MILKHLGDRAWRYGRMRRCVEMSDDGEVYAVAFEARCVGVRLDARGMLLLMNMNNL